MARLPKRFRRNLFLTSAVTLFFYIMFTWLTPLFGPKSGTHLSEWRLCRVSGVSFFMIPIGIKLTLASDSALLLEAGGGSVGLTFRRDLPVDPTVVWTFRRHDFWGFSIASGIAGDGDLAIPRISNMWNVVWLKVPDWFLLFADFLCVFFVCRRWMRQKSDANQAFPVN